LLPDNRGYFGDYGGQVFNWQLVKEVTARFPVMIAGGLGEETTVDQLVGQATAHHLEVLAEVRQRVQGQAQLEVDDAIQNRIQNHERVVTRLQAQNQLGEVPEETPIPEGIPENVQQRMSAGGSGQKP